MADKIFQNPNICLKAHIFSLVINTASCFPWSDGLLLLSLGNISPKYPCQTNHSLPGNPFFKYKWWCSMTLVLMVLSGVQLSRQVFTLKECAARVHSVCLFTTQNIKKMSTQGLRFNKVKNFYHCTENVLMWNWKFFSVIAWQNPRTGSLGSLLWLVLRHLQFTCHCFVPSVPKSTQLERQIIS